MVNSPVNVTEQFASLFEGNLSAFGTEEGGCVRTEKTTWLDYVWRIEAHLNGSFPPIGVYPMITFDQGTRWFVRWGCIDFDEGDEESWVHAKNVRLALQHFGIVGWVERSRSKGYHVWVFADRWIPARTMRHALLAACQLVEAPTKEINPKQEKLKEDQLGNYVRLPYPGVLADGFQYSFSDRRIMLDVDHPRALVSMESFTVRAHASRVGEPGLKTLATRYKEPDKPVPRRDWSGLPRTKDGIAGFAKWVAELPEGNRNMGLYWAAREALDQGVEDLEPLVEAAVEAGLSEMEARRTLESAERG